MKPASFFIVLIFYWVIWTLVKTIPIRKNLAKRSEEDYTSNDVNKTLNDGAESSGNRQIRKHNETLKPILKITKKDTAKGEDKVLKKSEYDKEYYQKNKERLIEIKRKYREQNKEKIIEQKRNYNIKNKEKKSQYMSIYYQKNKEKLNNRRKIYRQNNREKQNEYKRKWRQNKKNVQSDNNEGTSFVNPQTDDFTNLVKLSIVCEGEGNLLNQGEEGCNNEEENQIVVEDPNKILGDGINKIDSNKKNYLFDLNKKPEDEETED